MDTLKKYLDQVKADEALKEKTKAYVRASLLRKKEEPADKKPFRGVFGMKKLIVAASTVAACAVLSISGYAYSNTAVNFISLDINPSVELGLNAFDKVVSVEGINEDGQKLLREQNLNRLTVEEAIRALVEEAVDQDYIAKDGSTIIAVTAESDDENEALQLQERSAQGVNLAMSNKGALAVLYQDCSDLGLRTEAKELGISPGKLKLIRFLQTLNPDIMVEEYQNVKVSDIIDYANELLSSVDVDDDSDISDIIGNIQKTVINMEQNKARLINQKGNGNAEVNGNSQSGVSQQTQQQTKQQTQLQDQSCDATMEQTQDHDRDRLRDKSCITDPADHETDNTEDTDRKADEETSPSGQNGPDNGQQNSGSNSSGKTN